MVLRARAAAVLAALMLSAAFPAGASSPASSSLSPTKLTSTFSSGPNLISNPASDCTLPMGCDSHALTLTLPADFNTTFPDAQVKVELSWDVDVDYDLNAQEGGTQIASAGATGSPEVMTFAAGKGTRNITINIVPFVVAGGTATGKITLIPGTMAVPGAGSGGTPTTVGEPPIPANPVGPEVPRYQVYAPPPGLSGGSGEPSMGYNPKSGNAFILSGLKTLWAQFPKKQTPLLPDACEANWEERSAPETNKTSLDPIGFTDSLVAGAETGRTWIGQLGTKVHLMAYTDDDGKTWTPSEGNAPGTQGFDHQTIGAGPYPKTGNGSLIPHPTYANALYYCSQDLEYANCARSDNGGLTFANSTIMYTAADGCGGLHGHVRVAPDGTVYVPNPGCGGVPAAAVSTDAGLTWAVRKVTTATGEAGRDPQIAIAKDGTAYMCFLEGLNKAYMAVSKDKGLNWSKPVELGQGLGLKHATFTQAVAGDADRAACGFLGTTATGNANALDFKGSWYLFVATTYDGGKTFTTINATPNDPVQGYGGVWDGGGGNYNRNLLDFNEMSLDENGFVFYGFADGCIGACVNDPTNNSFSAFPKIARQVAGKSLYAKANESVLNAPAGACLAGDRTLERSSLSWREPENGGATITNYKVYRGTVKGQETFIGNAGTKALYRDTSADPAVAKYYYKVTGTNAKGEGVFSNTIELPIVTPAGETLCKAPGPLVPSMTDALGDSTTDANTDLVSLRIAEPQALDGKMVFTLKVASLGTPAPNTMYTVRFHTPTDDIASANDHFIGVVFDGGALPSYVYGATVVTTVVLASVTEYDIAGKLDAASAYGADGTITMVVPRSLFGLKAGDRLKNMTANVHAGAASTGSHVARSTNTLDAMGGPGDYAARAANFCLANANPLALLAVNKNASAVSETLQFSAGGSSDPDADALVEYFFDFGDGSQSTQSTPAVSHAYDQAGPYRATVQVKDARGLSSTNVAQQMIVVSKAGATTPVITTPGTGSTASASGNTGRFGGGAFGFALLPLLLAALRRRRA